MREQRCAAEREIQRERIPQADSVVPCSCGFKATSHTYCTVRAEAMTEARVRLQHMHVAFLAPISLFACVTFLPFVGKHIEDII